MGTKAELLRRQGNRALALSLISTALGIQESRLGPNHPEIPRSIAVFARLEADQDRTVEAAELYRQAISVMRENVSENPAILDFRGTLASLLVGLGFVQIQQARIEQSERSLSEALSLLAPLTERAEAVAYLHSQVMALLHLGRGDEDRPLVEKLLTKGWRHPDLLALNEESRVLPDALRSSAD